MLSMCSVLAGAAAGQTAADAAVATGPAGLRADYREVAAQLLGAALVDDDGWAKLEHLTQRIGHRLSGSPQLEQAIQWAAQTMRLEGLAVRLQPVEVPLWVRGEESLELLEPVGRQLAMLGLGMSVGTPEEGIEADVVAVRGWDDLAALSDDEVRGRIVLFAVPWSGYGSVVQYRANAASRAAARGAVAVLVRSATGRSLYTPHTGSLRYADDAGRIPAAAITVEDAEWLAGLSEAGVPVRVRLRMAARTLPDALSHNVIAEIAGHERPDEVVVIGGHFDSWDVGQGAHDDGAACVAAWHALTLIQRAGLVPRRTLRVVLWTNEENGLRGGRAYRESLGDEVSKHVAAIEMDGGAERPVGFGFTLPGADDDPDLAAAQQAALETLREIASYFSEIDADTISEGGGGADIGPLMRDGVPGMALRTVGEHYFDWHHTHADTLDKVEPTDFRRAVALFAVMGYVLADMPGTLGAPPPR
ncbi:MAG: M20/M25/M40 family metallo-hydrolase [Acidobacteria bacterium]|nr:MAG: M20/M25/M40 family metallo-hydrolase [Acidobacteriota bacterium]REK12214.1 MAG: M20/M25/M40 family metallo-hydrolase [Acidobacteriota bacterium]